MYGNYYIRSIAGFWMLTPSANSKPPLTKLTGFSFQWDSLHWVFVLLGIRTVTKHRTARTSLLCVVESRVRRKCHVYSWQWLD